MNITPSAGQGNTESKYLTFLIDGQLMAVSIETVVQIVGMQVITPVPEFPHYAKGIMNLRGSIIPIIDVRLRIGKAEKPYDERTCIIVSQVREMTVGFIVDAVDAVSDILPQDIAPPPVMAATAKKSYLQGVAKHQGKVILLLDTEKIISDEDLSDMLEKL